MRQAGFVRLLAIAALYNIATNLIHPITPMLIAERHLDSNMFGVMFAAMATGSFLTGPLWGKFADHHGRTPSMIISALGYGAAQMAFCYLTDPVAIVIVRIIGGGMVMGSTVSMMASAVDLTDERNRATRLAQYAAVVGVATALGYFFGGLAGTWSLTGTFYLQAVMLAASAVMMKLLLGETLKAAVSAPSIRARAVPLRGAASAITLPLALFFMGVVAAQFGTSGYDNAFNYYLLGVLGYNSSVNGIVKGVTGLLGLTANLTINAWVVRRFNPDKALAFMLAMCALTLAAVTRMPGVEAFFAMNIFFYLFNSMYAPIQQTLAARGRERDYGLLSGIYSSARSMGMVIGALSAGFAYEVSPQLPFIHQSISFAAAAALTGAGFFCLSCRARNK